MRFDNYAPDANGITTAIMLSSSTYSALNLWTGMLHSILRITAQSNRNDTIRIEFDIRFSAFANFEDFEITRELCVCISPGFSSGYRPDKMFHKATIFINLLEFMNNGVTCEMPYQKVVFEFNIGEYLDYLKTSESNFARLIINWAKGHTGSGEAVEIKVKNFKYIKSGKTVVIAPNGIASVQGIDRGFYQRDDIGFLIGGGTGSNIGFHKLNIGSANGNVTSTKIV